MTTNYRITFADGRQATMLDPADRPLPEVQVSILERFRPSRVREIEREPPADELFTEPPPPGGFFISGG